MSPLVNRGVFVRFQRIKLLNISTIEGKKLESKIIAKLYNINASHSSSLTI